MKAVRFAGRVACPLLAAALVACASAPEPSARGAGSLADLAACWTRILTEGQLTLAGNRVEVSCGQIRTAEAPVADAPSPAPGGVAK